MNTMRPTNRPFKRPLIRPINVCSKNNNNGEHEFSKWAIEKEYGMIKFMERKCNLCHFKEERIVK